MTCASRCAFRGVTTIGAASNHRLTHLAACRLHFPAGFADIFSPLPFSFGGLAPNCFLRIPKKTENKHPPDGSNNLSPPLPRKVFPKTGEALPPTRTRC